MVEPIQIVRCYFEFHGDDLPYFKTRQQNLIDIKKMYIALLMIMFNVRVYVPFPLAVFTSKISKHE